MRIAFLENPSWSFTGPRMYRDRVEEALSDRHELGFFSAPPASSGWDILHVLDVKQVSLETLKPVSIPLVADVHDHYWAEFAVFPTPDLPLRWLLQKSRRMHYRRILARADAVIAHAQVVAQYIRHANLHLVPYGLDLASLPPPGDTLREPIVLLVGRDCLRKGLPVMLGALGRINQRFPEARLVVIGDEYWHTRLWVRLLAHGLPVQFFPGMQFKEVVAWYNRASVLVLPSYIESFGLTILEAMAAGLPVVASAVGGITEQIVSGKNGFLIQPGDSRDLADKVIRVLEDKDLREEFVKKGQDGLRGRFDLESMAQKLEQAYQSVFNR
jgi:glycosyltransferase involved in cell wall biosynthesis